MASKKTNREAEKAAFELLKSKPAQWVIVGGVAIYLLPRAMEYLVGHLEQGTAYLLGAAWKGVTGKVDDAENAIEASGRYYRRKYDDFIGKESAEDKQQVVNEATTIEPRDQTDIESYKKAMNIPASAHFLMSPQDFNGAMWTMQTGNWSYYGKRIINQQEYYFLLPITMSLYKLGPEEEQFEHADEKGLCPPGWKRVNIEQIEMCTRTITPEILIPPVYKGSGSNWVLGQVLKLLS